MKIQLSPTRRVLRSHVFLWTSIEGKNITKKPIELIIAVVTKWWSGHSFNEVVTQLIEHSGFLWGSPIPHARISQNWFELVTRCGAASVRSMNILVNLTYRPVVLGCYLALCIMAARSTALWAVEPETYIDQGLAKAEAGNHAGAIEDFSRAIKMNPSLPMAYLARGQSRVARAEYRDAIKDYSRAIRLNNANAAAYLNRGQAHGMLKEYQAELDDSSQAIKIAPGYAEAYVNRGVAKTKLHDLRGAEGDFEQAIRLKPDLVASYYLLGIVRVMLGEARRGVDDYAKAMRLASGSPINDFSEAIKQDPKDPDPYVGRGLVYYVLRNKPATTNDFDQAARLRPMLQSDLKRLLNDPSVAWIQK